MGIVRCLSCDALSNHSAKLKNELSALCPCCHDKLSKPNYLSLSGELALAFAALLFFIPAQSFHLVSISLLGVDLNSSVTSGALDILTTFPIVALLVIFSTFIAPLCYLVAIFLAHYALRQSSSRLLSLATHMIKQSKGWVMIDVFLISLAVACFKVNEVTEVLPRYGLICFIFLHLSLTVLLSRLSLQRYWDQLLPPSHLNSCAIKGPYRENLTCNHCNLTQNNSHSTCLRCHQPISIRKKQSIQKTWAYLITATIFIFPANFYSISILLKNGKKFEDTIMSGVTSLIADGTYGIAAIIFAASILVPLGKILGLAHILCCIHFKRRHYFRFRTKLYRTVHFIGKWSMMDLFVITIMISLINRGNLLGFTPGLAANAFGLVVIFTMLAAESLDPRLIWDSANQEKLAQYHRQEDRTN